jgi:hypothetical protein
VKVTIDTNKCTYSEKSDTYVTAKGIISFAAIAKKWKQKDKKDDDGQFALALIFPETSDLSLLKETAGAAAKEKFGAKAKGIKTPFLDAAEKLDANRMPEGFDPTGWTMIRANTYQERPRVVNADGTMVAEDELTDELYNGRWARMSVRPKAFDQEGNKGVKFYLHNIQLLDEGEKWPQTGGRTDPEDEFSPVTTAKKDGTAAKAKSTDSVFSAFD